MPFQTWRLDESLSTLIAFIRLLPCMSHNMKFQNRRPCKCGHTKRTRQWLFSRVLSHMKWEKIEREAAEEAAAAEAARKAAKEVEANNTSKAIAIGYQIVTFTEIIIGDVCSSYLWNFLHVSLCLYNFQNI